MSTTFTITPSEIAVAREVVRARPRPSAQRGSWAELHPQADILEASAPGSELVTGLSDLTPADLDAAALLEGIAAWERVTTWAAAQQATLLAEMTRRCTGSRVDFMADDVSARLRISGRAADALVARAVALDTFPEVHEGLASGRLDVRKTDALIRETRHLAASDTRMVLAAVLDDAPALTVPALRAAVRRAELTVDPAATAARHDRARADRCIRMTPAPNSMAWLTAYLPATDSTTIMTALDAMAAPRAPQDGRSMDARRADALTGLMRQVLDTGTGVDGPLPVTQHRRPHLTLTVSSTSVAKALAGARQRTHLGSSRADDASPTPPFCGALAELAGYGPVPVELVMSIAAEANWHVAGLDPVTGELRERSSRSYRPSTALVALVVGRDRTCTFPGCRIPATRCDVDHIEPYDTSRPPDDQTGRTTSTHCAANTIASRPMAAGPPHATRPTAPRPGPHPAAALIPATPLPPSPSTPTLSPRPHRPPPAERHRRLPAHPNVPGPMTSHHRSEPRPSPPWQLAPTAS